MKGHKYNSLADLTDILGLRVITFYIDDVDKVASAVERLFEIDWENTVDKRKIHEIDSFGYLSLHYICKVPDFPYRFEVQMRSVTFRDSLMRGRRLVTFSFSEQGGVVAKTGYTASKSSGQVSCTAATPPS